MNNYLKPARRGQSPAYSAKHKRGWWWPLTLVTILGGALIGILTGCATTTDTSGMIDPLAVCGAWKSVSWSELDTDQTILEVKLNNVARAAWGCTDLSDAVETP